MSIVARATLLLLLVCLAAPCVPAADPPGVSDARFARIRRGINLSHWFAQSVIGSYPKSYLDTRTTEEDIELIASMGFDHVRFTLDPAPLADPTDLGRLNAEYLGYVDSAIDMLLKHGLAVVVDIHPSDEFKIKLRTDDEHVRGFTRFWSALARHLSSRDPERVFLEVINEPMVEDPYRWAGIQAKLVATIRAAAPRHTIVAAGHRWSGRDTLLLLEPVADRNVIYNFHYYEPFIMTHQGATWAGDQLPPLAGVPYPSSPEAVAPLLPKVANPKTRKWLADYGEERWGAERVDRDIAEVAAWAKKHGVRVTCNEFGVYRKVADPAHRAALLRDVRTALEKHGMGWAMWDYSGGFSVVNRRDGRAVPDEETVRALGLSGQ
jgi:aryl-phospho-beta-D-glucosidase BglC (GH1 family)